MLCPIVCHCGNSLGDLVDAFKLLRYKKISAALRAAGKTTFATDMYATIEALDIHLADELDQLGLHMTCCRMTMLGSVEFPLWAIPPAK